MKIPKSKSKFSPQGAPTAPQPPAPQKIWAKKMLKKRHQGPFGGEGGDFLGRNPNISVS